MNLNKLGDKDASVVKEHSRDSSSLNQNNSWPNDNPPSYNEALQSPPFQQVDTYAHTPTAPPPGVINDPNAYAQNDPRFVRWDNNATRILIDNRLQMQDQFANARSSYERDILWALIQTNLLDLGYHFTILEIINFWEFQFYIYKSIINSFTSSSESTNWEYFEPMNNVFSNSSSSHLVDSVSGISSGLNTESSVHAISTATANQSNIPTSDSSILTELPKETVSLSNDAPVDDFPITSAITSDDVTSTLISKVPDGSSILSDQVIMTQPETFSTSEVINNVITTQPSYSSLKPFDTDASNNIEIDNDNDCCGDCDCDCDCDCGDCDCDCDC